MMVRSGIIVIAAPKSGDSHRTPEPSARIGEDQSCSRAAHNRNGQRSLATAKCFGLARDFDYLAAMINGVHLLNFGNHRDTRMAFGRFNALVGQNGAGKSTVFRALLAYRDAQFPLPVPDDLLKPSARTWPSWYLRSGSRQAVVSVGQSAIFRAADLLVIGGATLTTRLDPASDANGAGCVCTPTYEWRHGNLGPADLKWFPFPKFDTVVAPANAEKQFEAIFGMLDSSPPPSDERKPTIGYGTTLPPYLCEAGKNIHYFKPAGTVISGPSYTTIAPPQMAANGENLASVVANMLGSDPDRFDAMLDAFRSVIPSVKRILTRRSEITIKEKRMILVNRKEVPFDEERNVAGDELLFDTVSGRLPMQAMSEGTMMALAILTRVFAQDGPTVLLLDDIEQGLHAKAQHDLITQLRTLQKQREDLQIILSTHSPFIIDEMSPEEVWLLHATPETGARARKLSEHPNAERALKVLSTGEFWSSEGEEWVTEQAAK